MDNIADNTEHQDDDVHPQAQTQIQHQKKSMAVTDVHDSAFCSFVHHITGAGGNGNPQGEKISYFVVHKYATTPCPPSHTHPHTSNTYTITTTTTNNNTYLFHGTDIINLLSRSLETGRTAKTNAKQERRRERRNGGIPVWTRPMAPKIGSWIRTWIY